MADRPGDAGQAAPTLLDIRNLDVVYTTRGGDVRAVRDFSLQLGRGECVGLVGESGCGKSTIAMAIMRFLGRNGRIDQGRIAFDGADLTAMEEKALRQVRGRRIAMIYQEPMAALNPSLTVGQQLDEVLTIHYGHSAEAARAASLAMLEQVRLPDGQRVCAAYPHQLSGGQQQRVVIAMALLGEPDLLLLDEPTTALDVTVQAGIMELLADIRRDHGTAMLFITHNLGLVREVSDRICVMYAGEVVEKGAVRDVFAHMRHPYTRGLFQAIPSPESDKAQRALRPIPGQLPRAGERLQGCRFAPRCAYGQAGRCDVAPIDMRVTLSEGGSHEVRCLRWHEIAPANEDRQSAGAIAGDRPPGAVTLQLQHMRKYYPVYDRSLGALLTGESTRWVKANEGVSFEARARETVAIVGESGSGKTTLAKVLMGLEQATEGQIQFLGDDVAKADVLRRRRDQLGALQMIFQNPSDTLNPSHSVGMQIGRVVRRLSGERNGARIQEKVMRLLEIVRLPAEFYHRRPRQLSGGQKQRVGIARAFAGNPKAVVADEPVSALDVSVSASVTDLLLDIQNRHDTTLLFISHDLSVVRYLADRIVVLYLGQVMEQGTTAEIFAPPYHPYTEALLSAVPVPDPSLKKRRIVLEGSVPSALNPPKGCPFASRCPRKVGSICDDEPPPVQQVPAADGRSSGHRIACHIPLEELKRVPPVFYREQTPTAPAAE